jgi:hypothetical protein
MRANAAERVPVFHMVIIPKSCYDFSTAETQRSQRKTSYLSFTLCIANVQFLGILANFFSKSLFSLRPLRLCGEFLIIRH